MDATPRHPTGPIRGAAQPYPSAEAMMVPFRGELEQGWSGRWFVPTSLLPSVNGGRDGLRISGMALGAAGGRRMQRAWCEGQSRRAEVWPGAAPVLAEHILNLSDGANTRLWPMVTRDVEAARDLILSDGLISPVPLDDFDLPRSSTVRSYTAFLWRPMAFSDLSNGWLAGGWVSESDGSHPTSRVPMVVRRMRPASSGFPPSVRMGGPFLDHVS